MGFDDPAQLVMVRDLPFPADSDTRAPDGAGLGDEWQTRIGTAFQGRTGAFNFGGQAPSLACTSGTERFTTATFDLPAGAAIKYVDMFAYDNSSSEDMLVFLLSVCQGTGGADPPVSTILANSTTSGTPGGSTRAVARCAAWVRNSHSMPMRFSKLLVIHCSAATRPCSRIAGRRFCMMRWLASMA